MLDLSRLLGRLVARRYQRSAISRYLAAILLAWAALLLTLAVPGISEAPFFTFFTGAIVFAAVYGGTVPGLVAVGASVFLNEFVVISPRFAFRLSDPGDIVRVGIFGALGAVLSTIIGSLGALQRKVENERERLSITLAGIGDGVIATDNLGNITFLNRAAESITGWTNQQAVGQPLETVFRIINEKTRARVGNPVRKVLETGNVVGLANHTVLIRKNGTEVPLDDSAAPIRESGGATVGVVLVFRDVTEKRDSDAALMRSEKLASVGRLASTLAHEINNPLESVTNLLYLASRQTDLSPATAGYLATARREVSRVAQMTKRTLAVTQQDLASEMVDLRQVADEVLELFAGKFADNHLAIHKKYSPCAPAEASSSEIMQVIANLVANATDALQHGGDLHVRISTVPNGTRRMIRLTVADNGRGISHDDLKRVFEPFFTTKAQVGTGLGLWVTQQIVAKHGGSIRFRSREGKGTVFVVLWPAAVQARQEEAAKA